MSLFMHGSETFDATSLVDGAQETEDMTVTGAALGDYVLVSLGVDIVDLYITATVTAADTVTVVLRNESTGTIDLASATLRVLVISRAAMGQS
ncbi:MAG: hypothetical protein ACXABY_33425 [Candidatus Thorarchaeota archaeon]|jgi:hypothetical protein